MEEVRAYVLLRQSQLSAEDRKKIVVEMGGKLEYSKVVSAIRLLGSRFFADLQGQRTARTKTYDANVIEESRRRLLTSLSEPFRLQFRESSMRTRPSSTRSTSRRWLRLMTLTP